MQKFFFEIRSRGFFLLVIAFLIITWLVYAEVTEQFDNSSILYFQSAAGNASLDHSMWILTEIGGIIPIMIFCFVMFVWRKTRRMGLIMLLAVLVGTVASGYLKDYVVERPRPDLEYLGSELPIEVESDSTVSSILFVPEISNVSGSIGQFMSTRKKTVLLLKSKSSIVRNSTYFSLLAHVKIF